MTKPTPKTAPPAKMPMFVTPKSMNDMQEYLNQFNKNEGVVAQVSAFMMYNLMCQYIEDTYHALPSIKSEQEISNKVLELEEKIEVGELQANGQLPDLVDGGGMEFTIHVSYDNGLLSVPSSINP